MDNNCHISSKQLLKDRFFIKQVRITKEVLNVNVLKFRKYECTAESDTGPVDWQLKSTR